MHPRDIHSYYENSDGQYSTSQYTTPGGDYTSPSAYPNTSYDYQQSSTQFYPAASQTNDASHTHPYYRSMTPGQHTYRYPNNTSAHNSPPTTITTPNIPQTYSAPGYYPSHYGNGSESRPTQSQTSFIPTHSEIQSYQSYPPAPLSSDHYSTVMSGYSHPIQTLSQQQNQLRPARISTGRPRTASGTTSPTSATSPSGERFPCDKCGKTFSRSHDRKRHHETQHLPKPVIYRCRYCEKEFSRADSLKRHLDNGCDEMPR